MSDTYDDDTDTQPDRQPRGDRQRRDRPETPAQSPDRREDGSHRRGAHDRDTSDRDTQDRDDGAHDRDGRKSRWPLIILGIVVLAAVIAGVDLLAGDGGAGNHRRCLYRRQRHFHRPEDSGYVTQLNVNDNTYVRRGSCC